MIFLASLLSFLTGFLSLCTEILWIRIFSYSLQVRPHAFAFVLVYYLLGIAFGALIGKRFCDSRFNLWFVSGITLVTASFFDLLGPFIYSTYFAPPYPMNLAAFFIFISALLKAVIFPIAHFLGVSPSDKQLAKKISRVYVANIIGATLGPIFVTYILLVFFTTQQAVIVCAILTFALGGFCLLKQLRPIALGSLTMIMSLMFAGFLSLNANYLIAHLSYPLSTIKRIIENQYGIISIYGTKGGDTVFGGNVYDGSTNLDPVANTNKINRLLILPVLQEKPKRILMIGLSIGTWLKLATSFPSVEKIDVIEINPGYLQAIQDYPPQFAGINDPRVNLVIDDGRRWLRNHPDKIYDLIISNSTFHWRAYATNLLSIEFIELIRSHMSPNAVFTYNSTYSPDALKTAAIAFRHAYFYENFVVAADFDWRKKLTRPEAKTILAELKIDGKPLFPSDKQQVIDYYLNKPVKTLAEIEAIVHRPTEVITDLNLITEYRYGLIL
ncbi:Spermidine synthase [Legionella massiliensis]|uniref:Spermidine synthase n=1 Tax=Legionella massiliensis TaxID=1034943 RepID=A0A078L102_9GAMM|nr:spermidine synthase [Legionella massiliensis]CDZ78846.1 Spermidine synthase [Legionella massiliensis]CEE14584.1 Spermidine synthase [Legionella massiliensis]